jgi:hypothetical protein
MKKLTLNLDALKVETFEPETSLRNPSGSVAAHQASALGGECATYNRQDFRCYASYIQPYGACTPVCGPTARCEVTGSPFPCIG